MATEEDLFAAIQSFEPYQPSSERQQQISAQQELVRQAKADVVAKEAAVPRLLPQIGAGLSALGQGLSLGLSDEALAGLTSLFGGDSYSAELARQAEQRKQMQQLYPVTSTVGEIAGGVAGTIPAMSVAAPSLASRLLLGATGKAAPTVGQLAAIGATQGGIYGAASAQPGERILGGLTGAGIGTVASPVLGKVAQYGAQKIGEGVSLLKALGGTQPELGAFGFGGTPKLSEAEIQLAKILSETAPENVTGARQALVRAGELGKPMFLPEAVESPALYQQAKFIANYPASIEVAETAIKQRANDAAERMTQTLDLINPQRDVTSGASQLFEGAKTILENLGVARKQATAPLYETAFNSTPQLTNASAIELIGTNKRIQQAIAQVKKEVPELADQPDTSLELLHQAQQYLYGKSKALKNKYVAGKITDARKALMSAINEESPDYAQATKMFAQMSKGLTAKEQSKLGFLAGVSPTRPESIGRVFALEPDVIGSLRNDFVEAGLTDQWEAGVRAYFQRALRKTLDDKNPINKFIGSLDLRDKLRAALGEKADRVLEPLAVEQQMLKGQRQYFAGSPTAPLQQTAASFEESKSLIRRAVQASKDPIGTAGKFLADALGNQKDKKFYEDYARLLFSNPEQGLDTLSTITNLAGGFRQARQVGEQVATTTGVTAGKESASLLEDIQNMSKQQQTPTVRSTPAAESPSLDDLFNQIQSFSGESVPAQPAKSSKVTKQNISMLADDAAATHGVSPSLVKAVIKAESNFNPSAKSKVGAQGLMQLMPDTAKMLGVTDAFDPAENVQGGAKYLKQLIDKFGDEKLALAAYNWGEGNIQKQLKKLGQKGKPQTLSGILKYGTLPDETEQYLKRVSKFKSEIA
jgi:soluble lytic murein transglycosylase-like protein